MRRTRLRERWKEVVVEVEGIEVEVEEIER